MKIVYVVEDYSVSGGVERIITAKANYFSDTSGYDVTVISIYEDSREPHYKLSDGVGFVQLGVPMARKSDNRLRQAVYRMTTFTRAAVRLNREIRRMKPDVIFFTTTLGALLLPLCHTRARKIFESHSSRQFTPYHRFFPLMERASDCVVCLTESDADEYIIAKDVKIIPNFIEKPLRLVTDYSVKCAVAVGRLEQVKGFDRLINCWAAVLKEIPGWQLDIWGEGSCREALQRQIDSLGLGESVRLRGFCDDMMNVYANYSLFLTSSHYEGMPMVLMETQTSGLPAVSFDFKNGARDIINSTHGGLLIRQNDTADFTVAMKKMMQSEEMRRKYGTAALKTADLYSKEEILSRWLNLING